MADGTVSLLTGLKHCNVRDEECCGRSRNETDKLRNNDADQKMTQHYR